MLRDNDFFRLEGVRALGGQSKRRGIIFENCGNEKKIRKGLGLFTCILLDFSHEKECLAHGHCFFSARQLHLLGGFNNRGEFGPCCGEVFFSDSKPCHEKV